MIVPMQNRYNNDKKMDDIYTNNAWLLDDKYMSYTTILSDKRMEDLIDEIEIETQGEIGNKRPDISIVFSGDPQEEEKVDVVIVELKRLGLELKRKVDVITQLRERARQLIRYYPNEIQRMWFYGVVDFDSELERHLQEDEFTKLFSKGKLYYKQQKIIPDTNRVTEFTVDLFVISFNTLIEDADARNSTFLEILKNGIKTNSQEVNDAELSGTSI